ncbi:MAG: potassium channel family protein [Proteobacteria bacterium]|nr:potassium channel family protein [Pseudomonadota bacterium]
MMHAIKTRLKILLIVFFSLIVAGTIGFMAIEDRSLLDAAYYVIVTVATVGYGDIHPVTPAGKLFAIVLIITGVGIFLGVIANVTEIMLAKREIESRMEKLNMVIGVFFSEVGMKLLSTFTGYDPNFEKIREELVVKATWTDENFLAVSKDLKNYDYSVDIHLVDLEGMRTFLLDKRGFLLGLLENPVLLEHQSFTDLLRAVFHVLEELSSRDNLTDLPESDKTHLAGDIKRAYNFLINEWLDYMQYLKNNYPYLFSLAMRTNPFDHSASIIIK